MRRLVLVGALAFIMLMGAMPGAEAQIGADEGIGVNGDDLTGPALVGVDDTTVFVYAVMAYCDGQRQYWGMNQNFPGPDNSKGPLECDSLPELWHQYFWLCSYYDLNLVRLGPADDWGTEICHEAMLAHPIQFAQVVDAMLTEAAEHDVYVCLCLAGSQEAPAYTFGMGSNPLVLGTTAYNEYVRYAGLVIQATERSDHDAALWGYDAWNEPTHSTLWNSYWGKSLEKYSAWSSALADDLCPLTGHIMCIGSGGAVFGWSLAAFQQVSGNGWDVAQWHYYASAEDEYLVTDPLNWAASIDKPLFVGEVGYNAVYPNLRWNWYEETYVANGGEALCHMTIRGTEGYPFAGTIPADEDAAPGTSDGTKYGGGGGASTGAGELEADLNDALGSVPAWMTLFSGIGLALSGLFIAGRYDTLRLGAGIVLLLIAAYQGMYLEAFA